MNYWRNNWLEIKDGTYVINPDEHKAAGTHFIALYMNGNDVMNFDRFGAEYISKEILKFKGNKNIKTNIFRIQVYDSVICGYFLSDLLILCLGVRV